MTTKRMNIAIVINVTDQALLDCTNIMQYLSMNHSVNFILDSQDIPHIGLSVGEVSEDNLDLIFNKIDSTLKDISPFNIKTNGLGIFLANTINIHLRWIKNNNIIQCKQKIEYALDKIWDQNLDYNNANMWLAKTSLAYKDIDYSNFNKINFNKLKIQNKTMLVQSLSIIHFEEGKKEKEIKKITLRGKMNE